MTASKFVDDSTLLVILNLTSIGLASVNAKNEIPADLTNENSFLPIENTKSQEHLNEIRKNSDKTKYMIINFCQSVQFNTRLHRKLHESSNASKAFRSHNHRWFVMTPKYPYDNKEGQ